MRGYKAMAAGRDLDNLFGSVGEMDEDRLRVAMMAVKSNAREDLRGGKFGVVSVGGEHLNGAVEGVYAGEEFMLTMEAMGEPFAEARRADGRAVIAVVAARDDGPGVAKGG